MAIEFNEKTSRDWLVSLLHTGPVTVTFTKTDGTDRVMRCSLREDLVVNYEKKTDKKRVVKEDILPVFDIDKQEWRSFRWDSIKRIEGSLI